MAHDETKLKERVQAVCDRHQRKDRISPTWVANEVMVLLDPERQSPHLVYAASHLHIRQLARGILRHNFEPDGAPIESAQHELWPQLQTRYPATPGTTVEPEYIKLEVLSDEDRLYNIRRLRAEGQAKLDHADALEAYSRDNPPRAAA